MNTYIRARGFSTIELLIAFAIFFIVLPPLMLLAFGGQTTTLDVALTNGGVGRVATQIRDSVAKLTGNWNADPADYDDPDDPYTPIHKVTDISPCLKQITATTTWSSEALRGQYAAATTYVPNILEAKALGGDCDPFPPSGGWNPPALFARDTINPGKLNTMDALQKIAYLGSDKLPYLLIADTRNAVFNDTSNQPLIIGSSIPYANAFNSDGGVINEVNDIDVFEDSASGKTYAFIAMSSSTAQLAVIDVTDIQKPVMVARRKLKNIIATDSTAWGWRLYYYSGKLYIASRETAGPEFHVFDVAGLLSNPFNPTPSNPSDNELGSGVQLTGGIGVNGTTVEDFVVRDGIAYFAAKKNTLELLVYDVSNPLNILHIPGASRNLPGNEDGKSIFLLGNKLFFGRQKNSGNEFYIFDASDPKTAAGGLPIFGLNDPNKEMDRDVTDIRVAGRFAFLASYGDASGGFKVWDISDPEKIKSVYLTFNFGNKLRTIDYENGFVYAGGDSTPNFQMLYSPN